MASLLSPLSLFPKSRPAITRTFFSSTLANRLTQKPPSTRFFSHLIPSRRALSPKPFFRAFTRSVSTSTTTSFWPATSSRSVGIYLLASSASVFGIVVWGGLTRLTESGLSITEWRPVTGSVPPMSAEDWEAEFAKYRNSPEFVRLNPRMSLDEFKKIYWMEWIHRLWGRVIGVTAIVPAVYLVARRRVAKHMAAKLFGIASLIGFQGFLGWWMVKSGLKDDLFAEGSHPRVSQYRLAAHLGTAFVAYSAMLLSGLSILRENRLLKDPKAGLAAMQSLAAAPHRRFRLAVTGLTALVFVTVLSGALVAGLDAGLIYNEFPWMGLGLAPPLPELFDARYSRKADESDLWWRNMLENPSLVQLDHRILAMTTYTATVILFLASRRAKGLDAKVRKGLMGVFHMANLQVIMGISTLLYLVPTWLAAMHQAGALMLLTTALIAGSRLRVPPRTIKLLEKQVQMMSKTKMGGPAQLKTQQGSVQQLVK